MSRAFPEAFLKRMKEQLGADFPAFLAALTPLCGMSIWRTG